MNESHFLSDAGLRNRRVKCKEQNLDAIFERLGGVWEITPFGWMICNLYDGPTLGNFDEDEQGILVCRALSSNTRETDWIDIFLRVR